MTTAREQTRDEEIGRRPSVLATLSGEACGDSNGKRAKEKIRGIRAAKREKKRGETRFETEHQET